MVLLNLAFLVHHVLAHDGVVLFDLHFSRRVFLVFIGRVEVARSCSGIQADFIS